MVRGLRRAEAGQRGRRPEGAQLPRHRRRHRRAQARHLADAGGDRPAHGDGHRRSGDRGDVLGRHRPRLLQSLRRITGQLIMVRAKSLEATDPRWYIVHTYSGQEQRVKKNLDLRVETMDVKDKILSVVVPTEEEIEIKDGRRKPVPKRIFPGYIIIRMKMDDESWHVVRNTPGVTGFVSAGGRAREPAEARPAGRV